MGGTEVPGRSAAAVAAAAHPGVETLSFLTAARVSALSPSDLVDAVIASERLLAHVNAVQAGLLAELGRPGRCGDITALVDALIGKAGQGRNADGEIDAARVEEVTRETAVRVAATEVAAVLDWSPVTAKIRIGQAHRMLTALPATYTALHAGRVDVGRARMITDRTAVLSRGTAAGSRPGSCRWSKAGPKPAWKPWSTGKSSPPTPPPPNTAAAKPPPTGKWSTAPTKTAWASSPRCSPPTPPSSCSP